MNTLQIKIYDVQFYKELFHTAAKKEHSVGALTHSVI